MAVLPTLPVHWAESPAWNPFEVVREEALWAVWVRNLSAALEGPVSWVEE